MTRKLPILASGAVIALAAAAVVGLNLDSTDRPSTQPSSATADTSTASKQSDRHSAERAQSASRTSETGAASPKSSLWVNKSDKKAGTPIAGSYIVTLKDRGDLRSAARIETTAQRLSKAVGGRLGSVYTAALRGFSVKMSAKQAKLMRARSQVASVRQDLVVVSTATQQQPSWNLDRIDQPDLPFSGTYDYATDAANVNIYMLDSGTRATHTDFGGRVKDGPPEGDNKDCGGHGTATASAAGGSTYGVAKAATLYSVRMIQCDGVGATTSGLDAVEWVTKNAVHPAVVNASWGTGPADDLDTAIRNSIKSGVTYVAAAGNDNSDHCNSTPSRVAEVIVVGASDRSDNRSSFSSYGSCVDVFAPGTDIPTAAWGSDTATVSSSGTSLSSPIVAGAAALYLSTHPTATPAQVSDAITGCASTGVLGNLQPDTADRLLNVGCLASAPLILTNPGLQKGAIGVPVRLTKIRTSGVPAGKTLRYSATGLPGGVSIDSATGVVSGTPTTAGATTARVSVTDGTSSASTSFGWDTIGGYGRVVNANGMCLDNKGSRLDEGNPIQTFDCGQNWIARADGSLEFINFGRDHCATASDTASSAGRLIVLTTCNGAASQIWKSTTAGELRNPASGQCLTALSKERESQLVLQTCNGSIGQQWKLPTGNAPAALTIDNPGTQSTLKGSQVWLKLVANHTDTAQNITFSATGLPSGLKIDSTTGRITGTVTTVKDTEVTVTAKDTDGRSVSTTFSWMITDGPITGLNGLCADNGGEKLGNDSTAMAFQCNRSGPQSWTVRSDGSLQILAKCMTVPTGATAGSFLPLTDCSGAATQIWQAQSGGTLKNPASGLCLNAPSSTHRTRFTVEKCNGSGNQVWTLPTAPVTLLNPGAQVFRLGGAVKLPMAAGTATRTYTASGLPAGLSIDATTGAITGKPTTVGAGTAIVTSVDSAGVRGATAFTWSIADGPIVGRSGKCVDNYLQSTDNNNPIIVWGCNTGESQLWTVGAKDTLEVQQKCLTVADDATSAGSRVVLFDCRNVASQVWKQQPDGTILNPTSGRCLNAPSFEDKTQFTLADCTAAEGQLWRLPTTVVPPEVSNPGDQRTAQGSSVELQVRATNNSSADPIFSATGLPTGLTVDRATGVVSGKATTLGTSAVTITVTTGKASASASFSWEVYEVRPTGTITDASGKWCIDNRDDAPWAWDCNRFDSQIWTDRSDGRLSLSGNRCLTPLDDGKTVGTSIVLRNCASDNGSQIWQPKSGTLVNKASGLCLNADGLGYTARFTLATCTGVDTQKWTLPTSS